MCKEYNGYDNYFTWNVSLWLDNDEYNYNHVREIRDNIVEHEEGDHGYSLAGAIRTLVEDENNPLADDASMYSDILSYGLSSVNWREIADNILEELEA